MNTTIHVGNAVDVLITLPDKSVHSVITSPPYWGLRSYNGDPGMIGLEATWDEHLDNLITVFKGIHRVLRDDGTLIVNYGDAYASAPNGRPAAEIVDDDRAFRDKPMNTIGDMFKAKDLMMMPSRLAIALQEDGWYLRSMIPLCKLNPMPESVKDRPTSAVEYFFLLSKSPRYYWDDVAVRTEMKESSVQRLSQNTFEDQTGGDKDTGDGNRSHRKVLENLHKRKTDKQRGHDRWDAMTKEEQQANGAAMRNYMVKPIKPYPGAHFATFSPDWILPFVRAGCPKGGTILDPFGGSGTTAMVANREQRNAILIEINAEYAELARQRVEGDAPMLNKVGVAA